MSSDYVNRYSSTNPIMADVALCGIGFHLLGKHFYISKTVKARKQTLRDIVCIEFARCEMLYHMTLIKNFLLDLDLLSINVNI